MFVCTFQSVMIWENITVQLSSIPRTPTTDMSSNALLLSMVSTAFECRYIYILGKHNFGGGWGKRIALSILLVSANLLKKDEPILMTLYTVGAYSPGVCMKEDNPSQKNIMGDNY